MREEKMREFLIQFIQNHKLTTGILIVDLILLILFFLTQRIIFFISSFLLCFFISITIGILLEIKVDSIISRNVKKGILSKEQAIHNRKKVAVFVKLIIIGVLFLSIIAYPYVVPAIKGPLNEGYLHEIVNGLIEGKSTDQEKIGAILSWFDRNEDYVHNSWILINVEKKVVLTIIDGFYYILSVEPYIFIRTKDTMDARWFLTNRIGACGEYSRIFMVMVDVLGIDVRRVHAPGEDHVWNEVKIDDTWIPVDPTNVSIPNGGDGWEDYTFFECKEGNASYVWAEYLHNNTIEDLTHGYTDLTNVTIHAVDQNNNSVSDVTITIMSNNLRDANRIHETFIKGKSKPKTNESGYCTFQIGGGTYKFKANDDKYKGETEWVEFSEKISSHNYSLILKKK
jgi:hypothetical protein